MKPRSESGFSLIEVMIVIAVLAILIGLALPSFRSALQNNRITAQANELVTAFHLARSEALKRNRPVVVCASSDGATCAGAWTAGWIVAEDGAPPGVLPPTLQPAIRVWQGTEGGVTFAGSTIFRFLPRGELDDGTGATFPATIAMTIPDCRGDQARNVRINRAGRVTVETAPCV